MTFDDLDVPRDGTPLDDGTGRVLAAKIRVPGDTPGTVSAVDGPRGAGKALQFPAPCDVQVCPRAIVEVMDAGDLSPGRQDFVLSAVLRMAPDETSPGSNVAQKGFSTGGGGQWKLQVDGAEGLPSCVLVQSATDAAVAGPARHVLEGTSSVADDAWHDVVCERRGGRLSLLVDGELSASTVVPEGLDISPEGPVRIGGKNVRQDNDQYNGVISSVMLSVAIGDGGGVNG
ncbi:LamG-like jellyroll fold domain-containing protein [Pseudokineococcus basanitobsidens]|uniref:LamG-like jellyroll fold domain-containing protein n=1 Tax=Pseudokineococcus basanitobsidens TaxID=1926649 RepID=UPI0030DA69C9